MTLTVRPVDIDDDAEYHAYCRVYERALHAETPDATVYGDEEARPFFRPSADTTPVVLGAFDDALVPGALVGAACAFVHADRPTFAMVNVFTDPAHRGRGVGTALVDPLVAAVADLGVSLLDVTIALPPTAGTGHEYLRFARRHGFRLGQLAVTRELALPVEGLDDLAREAALHHEGYRVVTGIDGLPDDLFAGYVAVMNRVAVEAPAGDLDVEASALTPEAYARGLAQEREGGRHRALTVAVAPGGEVVAATSLAATAGDHLDQYGTIVVPGHRGHRLGLAVKVANLAAAQREFPDKTRIVTSNAETNAHMVAVNERLGFRAVRRVAELQRRL